MAGVLAMTAVLSESAYAVSAKTSEGYVSSMKKMFCFEFCFVYFLNY